MTRLQKYLAECGVASRRAAETMIAEGRVTVNGALATLGQQVAAGTDAVAVDGRPVQRDRLVYVVLNKAAGVVTTAQDTHGRRTVLECLDGVPARVFPVGRLDMDVTGVLLLTNDGEVAQRLMHPRYNVPKVYRVTVRGRVAPEAVAQLERGVPLEDGPTAPAQVKLLEQGRDRCALRLTLREGRKREVKRMCAAVGNPVLRLRRVAFGPLNVKGLRPGEWRYLHPDEIARLRAAAGLEPAAR